MNGYDTRIQSRSPPCCFNNQLPNLHCVLKYIMYDAPKCTLQTLQYCLVFYWHLLLRFYEKKLSFISSRPTKNTQFIEKHDSFSHFSMSVLNYNSC